MRQGQDPSAASVRRAHSAFTRMNIGPIILGNQIEDRIESLKLVTFACAFRAVAGSSTEQRRQENGVPSTYGGSHGRSAAGTTQRNEPILDPRKRRPLSFL